MAQLDEPDRRDAGNYRLRFEVRALFSDMDAYRHVNNGATGRYFEEGRAALNMQVFGPDSVLNPQGGMLLLFANVVIDYLRQVYYPGMVEVATGVGRIGNTSFNLVQALFQQGACVALASSTLVKAVDGRPKPLDDAERQALHALSYHAAP